MRNEKQTQVYNYIKKNEGISQPELVTYFKKKFGHKSLNSSRSSMSRLLKTLETQGLIKKETVMNDNTGSIDKNTWYTNN